MADMELFRRCARLLAMVILLAAFGAQPASAHPADQHQLFHMILLTPDGLYVEWNLAVAPLLAPSIWQQADQDGDGAVSAGEAQAWATAQTSLVTAILDDATPLTFDLVSVTWPDSYELMQAGEQGVLGPRAPGRASCGRGSGGAPHPRWDPHRRLHGHRVGRV